MIIKVDRAIYDDECISKCVYSFLDEYTFNRSCAGGFEVLDVSPKSKATVGDDVFLTRWSDRLNDYKLRSIIERETKEIRTLLYAKAFMDCDDLTIG